MRKRTIILAVALGVLAACSSNPPQFTADGPVYEQKALGKFLRATSPARTTNQYLLGVGDRLDVVFFYHEDLTTRNLLVRSDGRITLPYVGDVMASGYTPMKLDSVLTDRFGEILRDPNLSVIVRESPDQVVYVLGQVKRPGQFSFERNVSVLQSIALAGGFESGAKSDHVLVIRRSGVSKILGAELDVKAILKGTNIQNDIPLRNLDIVYVPKTRVKSLAEFAQTLSEILDPPADLILRGWQIQVLDSQLDLLQLQN